VSSSDAFWEKFASHLYGGTRIPRVPEIIGSLWEMCGLQVGSTVVDICCGRGYSSLELAIRGAKVVAIDLSSEFIEDLRLAANALGLDIIAQQGNAQEVRLADQVCASVILWNSLGHQDHETDLGILANARRATHAGGSLALELTTLEELAKEPYKTTTRKIGESRSFRRIRDLNIQTRTLHGVWEIVDEDDVLIQGGDFSQLIYSKAEIVRMMKAAGWSYVTDSDKVPMNCEPTGTLFIGRAESSLKGGVNCPNCR
jgi:2-polyprenyl-3-methyl-5-hydroxy-6-metoxy-1,4-benzoquinol methylase